jgi:hypothetical protein
MLIIAPPYYATQSEFKVSTVADAFEKCNIPCTVIGGMQSEYTEEDILYRVDGYMGWSAPDRTITTFVIGAFSSEREPYLLTPQDALMTASMRAEAMFTEELCKRLGSQPGSSIIVLGTQGHYADKVELLSEGASMVTFESNKGRAIKPAQALFEYLGSSNFTSQDPPAESFTAAGLLDIYLTKIKWDRRECPSLAVAGDEIKTKIGEYLPNHLQDMVGKEFSQRERDQAVSRWGSDLGPDRVKCLMDRMTAVEEKGEISDDDFGPCLAICMELKPGSSDEDQTEEDYDADAHQRAEERFWMSL